MKRNPFSMFFAKKASANPERETGEGIFLPVHRRLGSCMTHRSDIVWIDSGMKKEEILAIVKKYPGFSRFPVCSGTVDSVLGVLPARRFITSLLDPLWPGLKALLKKPVYLPETATILRTLKMLEEEACQLAFIIDEYGGIEGIVTRNGIIGELLEEVADEATDDDPDVFRRDDGSWLLGGQVRMDDLRDKLNLPDSENENREYHTLAGYLLSIKGSIPKTGDRIIAGNYLFEIVDMDGHRIDKVLASEIAPTKPV